MALIVIGVVLCVFVFAALGPFVWMYFLGKEEDQWNHWENNK